MTDTGVDGAWDLIGLSDLEHQVYRRVVLGEGADAETLADALGCPAGRVRAALERLIGLGLLRGGARPGGPHVAVDPLVGLGSLVRERRHALDRIEATSHELSRVFTAGLLRSEPSRLFEVVEGRAATVARIHDLLGSARTEAVGIDTPPYVAPSSGHVSDAEADLLRRGVRFRALYASEVLEEPALVARIHWMTELGEQARVLPQVPMKLLIVDREKAVVLLSGDDAGPDALSVVAVRSALTDGLWAMFEQLWSHASPIRIGPRRGGGRALDAEATQLLDLLATGTKDETIARHLGVSTRTLRRRIAALLGELDATGRFQAGVRAAKRDLV